MTTKSKQRKINKQKKTKLLFRFIKVFNLPAMGSKSCQSHAAHANFILIMLFFFISLDDDIAEVSKIITSGNYYELVFILYHILMQFKAVFN